jgi:uncharacterized protein DUF1579
MKSRTLLGELALASLLALPVAAQDQPKDKPKDMTHEHGGMDQAAMEAMMKAAEPGEHHKAIGRYVGDWTYTIKFWDDPSKPPQSSDGTMHAEWMLGNRYVHSVYKGDMGGMAFEGHGTEGYDNVTKQYQGTWMDNMSTNIMYSTGSCDEGHKVCTSTANMADPMSGQVIPTRSVVTWSGDNAFTMEMYMKPPSGQEMKMMELTAKKKS